jgi:mono/diheme cytochrome c family protein
MVQLHFKEASKGEFLPTPADVVAHYSGAEWPVGKEPAVLVEEPAPPAPSPAKNETTGQKVAGLKIKTLITNRCVVCHGEEGAQEPSFATWDGFAKYLGKDPAAGKVHKLISAPKEVNWGKSSMVAAFFQKSEEWKETIKARPEAEVRAERETERQAMIAWLEAGASGEAYNADAFALPAALRSEPLTAELKTEAVDTPASAKPVAKPAKKRSAKARQVSVETLTQSTHAHLLSFAMMWGLTGFIFAFTSYNYTLRCLIAPAAVVFQVIDLACWWLARLNGVGPYFAFLTFIFGGIVGVAVLVHIIASVWNMYGPKGKVILFLILSGIAVGVGITAVKVVIPQLESEKQEALKG